MDLTPTLPKRTLFRARQKLGKYKIEARLADGPFACVYRAYDTIEGQRVALKIPQPHLMDRHFLDDFRKEVRLAARLDHDNILPVKDASFIDGHFVIALPLGERTLADRMRKRMTLVTALDYAEQMIEAVAHAHGHRVIHCDIKPENFILFPGDLLRLSDFGIAKQSMCTVKASGSGTIGYVAPEQAMGRPSFRSDVFSLGLIMFRLFAGQLPEWPFTWPPAGYQRMQRKIHRDLIELIRRAMDVNPAPRFRDAQQMLLAFQRIKGRALSPGCELKPRKHKGNGDANGDWRKVRERQFQRQYGKVLQTRDECGSCHGPVSEAMQHCPWCGIQRRRVSAKTRFPAHCPRCRRGRKLDWRYCGWCYGGGFKTVSARSYSDKRYEGRCSNTACSGVVLMPFLRYCPWCRTKVRRAWKIPGTRHACPKCRWGVVPAFWRHCPWCSTTLKK